MRSRVLRESVRRARGNRREIIDSIQSEISGRLKEAGIEHQVSGREKNLFSIYNKMEKKELQFHEVMDIYAFRVKVKDIDTCYRVLGQMHRPLQAAPRPLQGLHRHPQDQRLPVAAHLSGGAARGTGGGANSHRVHGSDGRQRGLPPTGPTSRMATARARPPRSAPSAGCRACWNCSRAPAAPLNLSKGSRPTSSPTKSTSLPRKGASWSCPLAPRRWILPTRCTPTSATPALVHGSTATPIRSAARCTRARRWRSSRRRGPARTRPGSTSW